VDLAALGAFMSGVGSVLTATFFVRRMRKRLDDECRKRMDALIEGIHIEREHE